MPGNRNAKPIEEQTLGDMLVTDAAFLTITASVIAGISYKHPDYFPGVLVLAIVPAWVIFGSLRELWRRRSSP